MKIIESEENIKFKVFNTEITRNFFKISRIHFEFIKRLIFEEISSA
jgi:hypothetical protein